MAVAGLLPLQNSGCVKCLGWAMNEKPRIWRATPTDPLARHRNPGDDQSERHAPCVWVIKPKAAGLGKTTGPGPYGT